MAIIPMKSLLESGVHFGHRTHKWHPGMKPYIFTERNGIHIIDLQKTVKSLETAYALIRDAVANGGTVLFVGTKRQAQETIQTEAVRAGMPYVTNRWLGGMLTNWRTIRLRINEMERLERMRDRGDFERLTKKEAQILVHEIERLEQLLGGIRQLSKLPDMVFVVDVRREEIAIHESNLLNIPVIAMVDTNCDPRNVDYVIPSNDDAIRAIKLMVGKMADAALEGRAMRKDIGEDDLSFQASAQEVISVDEEELTDEDLLGEATIAKITGKSVTIASDEDAEKLEELWGEKVEETEEAVEIDSIDETIVETETGEEEA
jgi:small subunit ribosomal protein S2